MDDVWVDSRLKLEGWDVTQYVAAQLDSFLASEASNLNLE
jgi:hypothetical protein